MNVTEEALFAYIQTFHEVLQETALQFLSEEHRKQLLHLSLLPAKVIGYVSTQFGTAIEYKPSNSTDIQIIRGSSRVEDLFVQAPPAARTIGPMFNVAAGSSNFFESFGIYSLTISGGFPFRLLENSSSIRVGDVAFTIGDWRREVKYAEVFGIRDVSYWSRKQAISRAKDEVLAALVQTKRANDKQLSLAEYITRFKERTILLLGDYDDEGLVRLRLIGDSLAAHGYEVVLIKDIPDYPVQDLPQKVSTVGALSRFVVVDDSSKSGHLMEVELCKQNRWITILLRKNGKGGSWMTAGASYTSNVILERAYDEQNCNVAVSEAVDWAEQKLTELQKRFDGLFPWRMQK